MRNKIIIYTACTNNIVFAADTNIIDLVKQLYLKLGIVFETETDLKKRYMKVYRRFKEQEAFHFKIEETEYYFQRFI